LPLLTTTELILLPPVGIVRRGVIADVIIGWRGVSKFCNCCGVVGADTSDDSGVDGDGDAAAIATKQHAAVRWSKPAFTSHE
jgi:hypothetical protein